MQVNNEDPRLTAFALGELDGDERDAIAAAVDADPVLTERVKEITAAAEAAFQAFPKDDGLELTGEQRQTIIDASQQFASPRFSPASRFWRAAHFAALAGCIMAALGAYAFWRVASEPTLSQDGAMQVSLLQQRQVRQLPSSESAPARFDESTVGKLEALEYGGDARSVPEDVAQRSRLLVMESEALAPAPTEGGERQSSNLQNAQVGVEIRVREDHYATYGIDPSSVRASGTEATGDTGGVPATAPAPKVPDDVELYQSHIGAPEPLPESPPADQPAPGFVEQRTRLTVQADFDEQNVRPPEILENRAAMNDATPNDTTSPPVMEGQEGEPRILAYDVGGDGTPELTPFHTRRVETEVHDLVSLYDTNAENQSSTPGLGASGFGGGGGNFGGGRFGGARPEVGYEMRGVNAPDSGQADPNASKLSLNYADPGTNRFIEVDSYDIWGEDFRSNYITARDKSEDVQIYQAYVDADEKDGRYSDRNSLGAESYAPISPKPFTQVSQEPLSTFSVDVDTASYANARRYLTQGQLPPPDAVRIEEMINYFDYEYAAPRGADPISVDVEIAQCVWETQHRLARIALKAREVPMDDRGPANLVFLIDVSGSMKDSNKLPLLKESMKALTRRLLPQDRVAIVTYRDAASIALSPTAVGDRTTIETAINALHAEGSTNGAGGVELAYSIASQNVVSGSINRVILATDGDFNVGETDNDRLVELIRNSAATGVFLTVLGFGEGNLKDDRLEAMADKGNGAYHYIDNYNEATRVLCAQVDATLATVAKDVKVQIEFNPQHVAAYRLIGYENRALAAADFNNDRKDAGEMGSGESVTALYELVPIGASTTPGRGVDELKYQANPAPAPTQSGDVNPETMTVKIRYKDPEGDTSRKFEVPVVDDGEGYDQSSRDYRWATAVAGFGMLLRHPASHDMTFVSEDGTRILGINTIVSNPVPDSLTFAKVREIAEGANGYDPDGRRAEFISLVVAVQTLRGDPN
ncbi:MAG: hypothetical protein AMXMBFR82_17180 [Candidatus Hydrogenedentota bacterium]